MPNNPIAAAEHICASAAQDIQARLHAAGLRVEVGAVVMVVTTKDSPQFITVSTRIFDHGDGDFLDGSIRGILAQIPTRMIDAQRRFGVQIIAMPAGSPQPPMPAPEQPVVLAIPEPIAEPPTLTRWQRFLRWLSQ